MLGAHWTLWSVVMHLRNWKFWPTHFIEYFMVSSKCLNWYKISENSSYIFPEFSLIYLIWKKIRRFQLATYHLHWCQTLKFVRMIKAENLKIIGYWGIFDFSSWMFHRDVLLISLCHSSPQGQVELVPLGPYKYHLKIFCKKAGTFTKVLEALCSYNAQITSLSTITFYGYAESVFCIEVICSLKTCLQLKPAHLYRYAKSSHREFSNC